MADAGINRWGIATNLATIFASVAAIAAFVASFCFFEETLEVQANANAVQIMNEHIKLFVENPELHECDRVLGLTTGETRSASASTGELPKKDQCTDAAEHAAFTAETILDLAPDDTAWKETVAGMIEDDRWWYESASYRANRYDDAFRDLVMDEIPGANDPELKAARARTAQQ